MTCNFNRPVNGKPALFTHDEVITLFHEFGHGLHHMLTRIDTAGVSGISGVPWDAVELPSQFMENWCWEPEALASPATMKPVNRCRSCWIKCCGEKLPGGAVYSASAGVRPVRFPSACGVQPAAGAKILETLAEIKKQVAVVPAQAGAASRTPSAISLPEAMRVTTAICGPTCWRRMPSRASRKGSSTVKPVSRSSITSYPRRF
jgi:oligopeptidase A